MNSDPFGSDESLAVALRDLYRSDVRAAVADWSGRRRPASPGRSAPSRPRPGLLLPTLVASLAVVAVMLSRQPSSDTHSAGATDPQISHEASTADHASPSGRATEQAARTANTASSTLAVGPLIEGLPRSIGGEPVIRGSTAIRERIESSSDSASFLIGGWFHRNAGSPVLYCPAYMEGTPWWVCSTFVLYDRREGGSTIESPDQYVLIYPGDPARIDPRLPSASTAPVVLRINTHDRSCPPQVSECSSLPVLLELVWRQPNA
jgi:hypothetical protein